MHFPSRDPQRLVAVAHFRYAPPILPHHSHGGEHSRLICVQPNAIPLAGCYMLIFLRGMSVQSLTLAREQRSNCGERVLGCLL